MFCNMPNSTHFSDTIAFLQLEPQWPSSMTSLININGTAIPEILDYDLGTCLSLDKNEGKRVQISLPYIRVKGQFYVSLMGNLKCSPFFGLSVSVMSDCEGDTCSYSQCIANDLVTSDGVGGCKYRCHSFNVCNHIVVDVAAPSVTTLARTLCEIGF